MNKQELIEGIEAVPAHNTRTRPWIDKKIVLGLLRQLDEPEKVKVPQLIADWIEVAKPTYSLYGAMVYGSPGVNKWLENWNNQETFALAWIFGYEVEKEPKYIVKLKNVPDLFGILNFGKHSKEWIFSDSNTNSHHRTKHTRKELEEDGFGWVFDCEGIEIEEVK
jgi:hypothetical protein